MESFDNNDIKSESTPKSILKKYSKPTKSKVLFSPTKEVKKFKDFFESSDDLTTVEFDHKPDKPRHSEPNFQDIDKSLLQRILTDSNIPYVLSLYLQLMFNLIIIGLICYFIVIFIQTIKSDINNKVDIYVSDTLQEISKCSREYYRNKCDNAKIPPLLENKCTEWSKCMNRDPQLIGRSKLTAEIFADIINGFIRPISWKSIFFLIALLIGSLVTTNFVFNNYRNPHNMKIDNLELIIKQQNKVIESLKDWDYLDPIDDDSIESPLLKKSV